VELQQLRYVVAVYENACNVSLASRRLRTSQPAISRQIRLLEQELGFPIFDRSARGRARPTQAGNELITRATALLREAQVLRRPWQPSVAADTGALAIAASDPELRHVLPAVVARFRPKFPGVSLHLYQGTRAQAMDLLAQRRAELAFATDARAPDAGILWLPCYRWQYRLLVPRGHVLERLGRPLMTDLVEYPLITGAAGPAGRAALEAIFETCGLAGNVVMTATGSDVVEVYVQQGIGIGIVAMTAASNAPDIVAIDASHLFETQTTWVGMRRDVPLPPCAYAFLELLAPSLSRLLVEECVRIPDHTELDPVLDDLYVPLLG
jgi:LysR family cys regulon transcriptional activator